MSEPRKRNEEKYQELKKEDSTLDNAVLCEKNS